MLDPFFLDETADEQQIGLLHGPLRKPIRFRLYTVADDFQLRCRKIAGEQRLADVLRDADDQRRLPLQCFTAPLEDGWNELSMVVPVFGCVTSMEGDHQREPQGASDRQRQRAPAAKMGMDQLRPQHREIRRRRHPAELLEQESVEYAGGAAPAEQDRFRPQVGQADILSTADPNRRQTAKADILSTQEMGLRAWDDTVSIDEQRAAVGQNCLTPTRAAARRSAAADWPAESAMKAAPVKRPLSNHSCQITKLTTLTETAAAGAPAIIA